MYKYFWILLFCTFGFSQSEITNAKQHILNKRYKKAQDVLQVYVDNNPDDKTAIELLGDAYGYRKKWDSAIKYYKILVDKYSSNADYHYKYGGALGMKALSISKFKAINIIGDVKKAFLTAVKLDPKHINAHWALVDLYVSLPAIVGGSNAKAMQYAKRLQKLSKLDGYLAIAYVHEYDKNPELAATYYKKAMSEADKYTCSKYSNTLKILNRNANRYQIAKVSADYNLKLDKGIKCIDLYLKNHSSKDGVPKEWAYYRLAQIYKHKSDKEKALYYINKALKIKPRFKQALTEKATISKL